MYLGRLGAVSISHLSDYLDLLLGTTSHLVDQLVGDGYVLRIEDPNDRRLKQVVLSERGHAFVTEVWSMRVADMSRRLADMPEPLVESLIAVMSDVTAHLQASHEPCAGVPVDAARAANDD